MLSSLGKERKSDVTPRSGSERPGSRISERWTNGAAQVLTPINLPTWGNFASWIKLMIERKPGSPLGFAKDDHSGAYKQLPLRLQRRERSVITLRDPGSRDWEAFLPNTQLLWARNSRPPEKPASVELSPL